MPKGGAPVISLILGGKGKKPGEAKPGGALPSGKGGAGAMSPDAGLLPPIAPGEGGEGGEYGEAFSESAGAAYEAVQAGDAGGFEMALKDAILTCLEDHGVS
ncbi:MAG: hypothetical protein CL398_07300 [Acidiferrobacteraceae bacterium]|nr:hypothetical protein [Acidiferrobacteraceae bacterium]|tara:strand:+ start:898 stop:1203 length:306 start_codon:yes stop_codon:yes gene_type:complete